MYLAPELRRLGAQRRESFMLAARTITFTERAPVSAQGAEVLAPDLGAPSPQEPRDDRAEGLASASSNFPCHSSEVARG